MATWLNGCRYGSDYFELQAKEPYFDDRAEKITKVLIDPDTNVRIACSDEDIDFIVGFAAFTIEKLHWVYIRDGYRKGGIARLLLNGTKITKFSGFTKTGASIAKAKGFVFEPL